MNARKVGPKLLFSAFIVLATSLPVPGAGQQTSSLFDRELLSDTTVQSAFRYIESNREAIVQEWITLTEIPAPSTMEERRAAYLVEQLEAIGVDQISIDERGNIIATLKGTGGGPTVALAAHMDTVFEEATPIQVRREEERRDCMPPASATTHPVVLASFGRYVHSKKPGFRRRAIFWRSLPWKRNWVCLAPESSWKIGAIGWTCLWLSTVLWDR